jgi:hypothetical protein
MSLDIDAELRGSFNTSPQYSGCEVSAGAEHLGSGS